MDTRLTQRQALTQIIQAHAQYQPSHDNINTVAICDPQADNYLLIDLGWRPTERVHDVIIQIGRASCRERV